MRSRGLRRVALTASALGALVLAAAGVAFRESLLDLWYTFRFEQSSDARKWELAARLETSGSSGRSAVEGWYLEKTTVPDRDERNRAVKRLGAMRSREVAPRLIELVTRYDPLDEETHQVYTDAILALGPRAAPVIAGEVQNLGDMIKTGIPPLGSERRLLYWFSILRRLGAVDRDSVRPIVDLMDSSDRPVRFSALQTLERTGSICVAPLAGKFERAGVKTRLRIISIFAKLGPQAEKAVPTLVRALKDENELVRFTAAKALAKIRGEPSHP